DDVAFLRDAEFCVRAHDIPTVREAVPGDAKRVPQVPSLPSKLLYLDVRRRPGPAWAGRSQLELRCGYNRRKRRVRLERVPLRAVLYSLVTERRVAVHHRRESSTAPRHCAERTPTIRGPV